MFGPKQPPMNRHRFSPLLRGAREAPTTVHVPAPLVPAPRHSRPVPDQFMPSRVIFRVETLYHTWRFFTLCIPAFVQLWWVLSMESVQQYYNWRGLFQQRSTA
jgi:hypothetical protein